jgi:hypothetical protein
MCVCLRADCYSYHILMKPECRQIFENYCNIKFHTNPSSGSRVFACGRTDGRSDMTKLVVAFLYFANAPKNYYLSPLINGRVSRKRILKQSYGGEHTASYQWDRSGKKYKIQNLSGFTLISYG